MVVLRGFKTIFAGAAIALGFTVALPARAAAQTPGSLLNLGNVNIPTPARADVPAPAAPRMPSPYSWTGLYVGGVFGNAMGKGEATTTTVFDPAGYFANSSVTAVNAVGAQELKPTKFMFGGAAGFVGQAGAMVLGSGVWLHAHLGLGRGCLSTAL